MRWATASARSMCVSPGRRVRRGTADAVGGTPFVLFALIAGASLGTQGREISQRQHGERDMTMPTMPTARLAMVEPNLALGGLETLLNCPAPAGDACEVNQARLGWGEYHVVGAIRLILSVASDQQPMLPWRTLQAQKTNTRPVIDPWSLRSLSRRVTFPGRRRQRLGQLGRRAARMVQKPIVGHQPLITTDRQNVVLSSAFQHHTQTFVAAVDGIGKNPRAWHSRIEGGAEQLTGDLWLGREGDVVRYSRLLAPHSIGSPLLRKIESAIDERLSEAARIAEKHPNLTVLNPPRRTRILASNPNRMFALLHKSSLVDHQNAIVSAKLLHHIVAHQIARCIAIPVPASQYRLDAPGARIANPLRQLPAGLALNPAEQSIQIRKDCTPRLDPPKQNAEAFLHLIERTSPTQFLTRKCCNCHLPLASESQSGQTPRSKSKMQL